MTEVCFEEGYKDEYKVVVYDDDGNAWAPTNRTLFKYIDKWLIAEDEAFGDGYGRRMPLLFVNLIGIGETDKALRATDMEGHDALDFYEKQHAKHKQDIVDFL